MQPRHLSWWGPGMTYLSWTISQRRKCQGNLKQGAGFSWFFLPSVGFLWLGFLINVSTCNSLSIRKLLQGINKFKFLHETTTSVYIDTENGDLLKTRLKWFSWTGENHINDILHHVLWHLNSSSEQAESVRNQSHLL